MQPSLGDCYISPPCAQASGSVIDTIPEREKDWVIAYLAVLMEAFAEGWACSLSYRDGVHTRGR